MSQPREFIPGVDEPIYFWTRVYVKGLGIDVKLAKYPAVKSIGFRGGFEVVDFRCKERPTLDWDFIESNMKDILSNIQFSG